MRRTRRHRTAARETAHTTTTLVLTVLVALALVAVVPDVGTAALAVGDRPDGVSGDTTRVVGDSLNATATPATVAASVGDSIEVSGSTDGSVSAVRLYLVGPRGTFLDEAGRTEAMETASVADETFAVTYAAFSRRGSYSLLVVSPRADGSFETTETLDRDSLPSRMTRDQAVDTVKHAYSGDEVVELTLRGETPSLAIDPIGENGTVPRENGVEVSGTSNRGDGRSVTVDVLDADGRVVTGTTATVDASAGRWSTELDTSTLDPGTYTLYVDDLASTASAPLVVVDDEDATAATTPAETPIPDGDAEAAEAAGTPDAGETVDNVTGAALANATDGLDDATSVLGGSETNATTNTTANETANASATGNGSVNDSASGADGSTSEGLPGFGVVAALAAVVVLAAAARRRTDG
ncbi:PGF-CTERM sorting domain-containing protein [Salinigranum salinum]|uniref:PGF-CTERM sorting domain-containing protein n=1 Tax=Salinigranum salinum TaxID=1364937 RepID=UPI0012609B62|nr:PGF-CTERM sorting domain-containing protein [Salinigranum salinum]